MTQDEYKVAAQRAFYLLSSMENEKIRGILMDVAADFMVAATDAMFKR